MGAFSFQSSKTMRSAEGGAVLTGNEDYYWRIVSQRSCGREFKPGVNAHSGNYRLTSLQAALLRGQLAAMRRNAPIFDRTVSRWTRLSRRRRASGRFAATSISRDRPAIVTLSSTTRSSTTGFRGIFSAER